MSVRALRRGTMAGRGASATTYTILGQTVDGMIRSVDAAYATASAGPSPLAFPAEAVGAVGQLLSGSYFIYEVMLSFDTSAVVGTIQSVALSLYGSDVTTSDAYTLEVRLHDWGTAIEAADWVAGASLSGKTLLASRSTTGLTAAYNDFTSEAAFPANINQSGVTRLLLNSSRHRSGTAPTADERISFYTGAQTGTANDPKLVIVAA